MMDSIFRKANAQTLDYIFPQHCVLCGSIVLERGAPTLPGILGDENSVSSPCIPSDF